MHTGANDHPLEYILGDISKALDAGFYYVAIAMALTVPDICSALGSEGGRSGTTMYHNWYNKYLAPRYPEITPTDIYSLRCGVVHQGRMGRDGMKYSRIVFTMPDGANNVFHRNIMSGALNLDAAVFCREIIDGARQWCVDNAGDANVAANIPNLVRHRPNGLAPYFVGIPVIA